MMIISLKCKDAFYFKKIARELLPMIHGPWPNKRGFKKLFSKHSRPTQDTRSDLGKIIWQGRTFCWLSFQICDIHVYYISVLKVTKSWKKRLRVEMHALQIRIPWSFQIMRLVQLCYRAKIVFDISRWKSFLYKLYYRMYYTRMYYTFYLCTINILDTCIWTKEPLLRTSIDLNYTGVLKMGTRMCNEFRWNSPLKDLLVKNHDNNFDFRQCKNNCEE